MLSDKEVRNTTSLCRVTLQRIIKNMGKGSQPILNIESKIQDYIANISFSLFKQNKYTHAGEKRLEERKYKLLTVVVSGVKFEVIVYHS